MKNFDARKQVQPNEALKEVKYISLAEYANLPKVISSEERLSRLPIESWSPQLFRDKTIELIEVGHLEVRLIADVNQLPRLAPETKYRYAHCSYAACHERQIAGERFLVSVTIEGSRVIGYAIAVLSTDASAEIEIVDVDMSSQRSSGLKVEFIKEGERFSVGVAYLLVDAIACGFQGELRVDATGASSRYVFKSLGFVQCPEEPNPCQLWRPARPQS